MDGYIQDRRRLIELKKHLVFILTLGFIFIIAACNSDQSLSKEEVIQEMKQQIDKVESYQTGATISVVLTDVSSENIIESDEGVIQADVIETTFESTGESIDNFESKKHYATNEAIYIQMNDEPWKEGSDQDILFNDSFSFYEEVAQILIDLEDEKDLQMEIKEDTYTFTFTGKSASIYEAFEDPYFLSLTGATPNEMEQDMTIIVDRETFYLKQVKNSFTVEKEGVELVISIDQTYEKVNDIDDIGIPNDVIEEASKQEHTERDEPEDAENQAAKEAVITAVEEQIGAVENYHTNALLAIDIVDIATREQVDTSEAIQQVDVIENPMESSGILVEDDVMQHYYATSDATYVQFEGQPWEDYSDQADQYDLSSLLYQDVAQILIDLKEEKNVQMEEINGKYVFTFFGKSEAVYVAFETPYSLTLTGATPDELEQSMTITIDRDTFFIEQVENFFVVEKEGLELSIILDHSYEQINEINEITIPEDVVREAN